MTARFLVVRNGAVFSDDETYRFGESDPPLEVRDVWVNRDTGMVVDPPYQAGDDVEVVDATGTVVLPGFTDGHIHLSLWLQKQDHVDLSECTETAEVIHRLQIR